MKKAAVATLAALLLVTPLAAHEFWIVPFLFHLPDGWVVQARGQTGMEFPHSLSAVTPDRLMDAALVSGDRRIPIEKRAVEGTSLLLEAKPDHAGQWWVTAALHPRALAMTRSEFREYLIHDGVWTMLARWDAGEAVPRPDSVRERYRKYAKALVSVGEGGPHAFDQPVGHRLEIVPLVDPHALRPGDELAVRLLWQGEPLPDTPMFSGRAGAGAGPTAHAVTDADGVARFRVYVPGTWYVRTIHMETAPAGDTVDYASWWATMTFMVEDHEG